MPEQETEDEFMRATGTLSVLQIVGIILGSGLLIVIGLKGFDYFLVARLHLVPSGKSAAGGSADEHIGVQSGRQRTQ